MATKPSEKALREVRSWLGSKGGKARANTLSKVRMIEIARMGGLAKNKKTPK